MTDGDHRSRETTKAGRYFEAVLSGRARTWNEAADPYAAAAPSSTPTTFSRRFSALNAKPFVTSLE